jgi:hypothetical protein
MSGEPDGPLGEIRIGATLVAARERADLDLADVEERTKIRTRYLSALEEERWDDLPSRAYGKGFLRTYAQLLGLDAETLADEYRRQVEAGEEQSMHPLGDAVLEERRRRPPVNGGPRLGLLLGLAVVLALGGVLVIALVGPGDEDKAGSPDGSTDGHNRGHGRAPKPEGTVELGLAIHEPVEVCLLGGGKEALIDGQVLAAGDRESFERQRFELRFPKGFDPAQLTVKLDGRERRLPKAGGPATYEIVAPQHLKLATHKPRQACP